MNHTTRLLALKRTAMAGAILGATMTISACGTPASTGVPEGPPAMQSNGMLIALNGKTLYTFDKDTANTGKSACNGLCAVTWPPLTTTADAGKENFTVITRDDKSKQWAYKGKPLYFYSKDNAAGEASGEGFLGLWHTVAP